MHPTSTSEHLADQLALSRLDDDGAPLGAQGPADGAPLGAQGPADGATAAQGQADATTAAQASSDGARISLRPATAPQAGLGGGWWPRSRDATAELPGLLAELSGQTGRVSRVALPADAFDNIPHQLTVGGRKVRVAWFRSMNINTVLLTMADRDDLVLLVVPPQALPAQAAQALGAAAGPGAGPADAILAGAGIAVDRKPARSAQTTSVREHG